MASSCVFVATGVALLWLLVGQLSNRAWAEAEARLRTEVLLLQDGLGAELESTAASGIQERTVSKGQAWGIRITLIRADGTVLSDSEGDPERMDNLASRPEVVAALSQDFGSCHRMSPTTGVDALFLARAVRRGDHFSGWIRAAVAAERVRARLYEVERTLFAAAAVSALIAAALGVLWTKVWLGPSGART